MLRYRILRVVVAILCVKAYFLAEPLISTVTELFAATPAPVRYVEMIDPYWVSSGTDGQIIRSLRDEGGKRTGRQDAFGGISPVRSFRSAEAVFGNETREGKNSTHRMLQ